MWILILSWNYQSFLPTLFNCYYNNAQIFMFITWITCFNYGFFFYPLPPSLLLLFPSFFFLQARLVWSLCSLLNVVIISVNQHTQLKCFFSFWGCVWLYMYTHIHVKASGWCQVSFLIDLHFSFLRQGISLKLEFAYLARLAGKQVSGIFLSLSPRLWDRKNFYLGLEDWTQVFMLSWQTCY